MSGRSRVVPVLVAAMLILSSYPLIGGGVPDVLPRADKKAPDAKKPIKVFALAGQSNMLEMGKIAGRGGGPTRSLFKNTTPTDGEKAQFVNIAVYEGAYSAEANYGKMEPVFTGEAMIGPAKLKRVKRRRLKIPMPPLPGQALQDGRTTVFSGYVSVGRKGTYEFRIGDANGGFNLTTVDGKQVYRRDVGQEEPKLTLIKLEPDKRYAFETVCFQKPDRGFAVYQTDVPGALETLALQKKYAYLKNDDGSWVIRNDVFFRDVHPLVAKGAVGNFLQVPAKPGGRGIGIELAFGSVMGTYYDEPVLLIRSACGNRGLWSGFRPPSRGGWEKGEDGKYTWTGTEYRFLRDGVKQTLENIADIYPGYAGQGYELVGFVWFQGHKDTGGAPDEYEENMVALINDVRKEFGKPKLPVMIATVGFEGKAMSGGTLKVHDAQMAVGDAKKHPEFKGTVKTVDTVDFWRPSSESPTGAGYHYNGNSETYMLVGESLGRGMLELLGK